MVESLKEMLQKWNTTYTERSKLQHSYIVLIIIGIILAGLVGLLNYEASRVILHITFAVGGILIGNAIAWALLSSMVLSRFTSRKPGRK